MFRNMIISDKGYKDLNPVQFGYQKCDAGHAFGPAVRTHWLLHYVVSGKGYYRIDNREYNIGANDIFVIPPYKETYYAADTEDPWVYTWIGFSTEAQLPAPLKDVIHLPEARGIFTAMKSCNMHDAGCSAFLSAKLWELFAVLLRNQSQPKSYVENALDCMHAEYTNGITVDEIAHRLNLDRSYFSTLFKNQVGVSPKQYLLAYRMQIAAELMCENNSSVSVAACSVGYNDVFIFSKMFKRHFGVSPSEYVKQNKNHESN